MALKVITTEDGSRSLWDKALNETYHSTRGARGESMHVFIKNGLDLFCRKHQPELVNVLEVGMGTGLNVFLTAQYALANKQSVLFTTLEPYPIAEAIYTQLNYATTKEEEALFENIHECRWEEEVEINAYVRLLKRKSRLEDYDPAQVFQVVYYDAFAPSKQAEVWSTENLAKCFDFMDDEGVLTTYCAQGQFKRNLKEVGFVIETLQGAMGKKEMVLAIKE